ncbi:MAG: NYN domain-containing protein [Lachnospiraceae bacterium]
MESTSENKPIKHIEHISIGLLAHVDAGKTTLAESMLYFSGKLKKLGRVDHKDTFFDTNEIERERGITIFSKQAELIIADKKITLLDTPGHVDFSAETERALMVMDYVVLVISASAGIQSHVMTLWKLLSVYKVPVFIFVNKMDMPDTDMDYMMRELKNVLSDNCICFNNNEESMYEDIATGSEDALTEYFETGKVSDSTVSELIKKRLIFPCFFGSALRLTGVENFMEGLGRYMSAPLYPEKFGAKIYKISRDNKGVRLTHMKVMGGVLKSRMEINSQKVNQIRIYSGETYETVDNAYPGMICAVTGLDGNMPGEGLGITPDSDLPVLTPVLVYRLILPKETDVHKTYMQLKDIEEEEPQLSIVWNEKLNEINIRLMGEIQTEVLKRIIRERLDINVEFDTGNIVYRETIAEPVEGIGHYEPLRHYAEVHILMEPLEAGSGIQIESNVSEDVLDKNWQRLIMTNLYEKKHVGVLTGSEITDMKLTVIAGKAHLKHTEGGDFRQASYRAVRQGLMKAKSVLLEPVYDFVLELPSELLGRAINDIALMNGKLDDTRSAGENVVLYGSAPVECMQGYQITVASYSKGRGRLTCTAGGYMPCHNAEEVIDKIGYDAAGDIANPSASIFCSHGAGFYVSWEQVEDYMHIEGMGDLDKYENEEPKIVHKPKINPVNDEELEAIFTKTYGEVKRKKYTPPKKVTYNNTGDEKYLLKKKKPPKKDSYLLVDGYNIIFAWKELKELAENNLESARVSLMETLCNYQGFAGITVILVFDAYRVKGNPGEVSKYKNIHLVYTKEAETADQYIEKTVHRIGKNNNVTVATSDALEQVIIFGAGANRMSASGLKEEILRTEKEIREHLL